MTAQHLHLTGPGRTLIAGAPEGFDALVLSRLVHGQPAGDGSAQLVHVARDDARLAKLADAIAFFAPDIEILLFPAWDCLPYDRVSPHRDIVSQRIDTLTRLLKPAANAAKRIVLTTVAALLQRVPTPEFFDGALFPLRVGGTIKPEALVAYLAHNGYTRSETVNEAGEFAVRGGIVDLFPPGAAQPLRLDFFGDDVESIRAFDPLTQRSSDKVAAIDLKPVSEFRLDARAIELFRSRYRERFGTAVADDPLYEAVSAGRLYAGIEHWLPLYHERLGTLLDYAPGAAVTLDYQADESRDARIELIGDFYEARLAYRRAEEATGAPYRPLPTEMLYLTATEWDDMLGDRAVALLSPFDAPGRRAGRHRRRRPQGPRFRRCAGAARRQRLRRAARSCRRRAEGRPSDGHRRLHGRQPRPPAHLLRDHGIDRQRTLPRWSDLPALTPDHVGLMALPLDAGFQSGDIAVIAEADIVGDRLARPAKKRKRSDQFLAELANFAEGDYVVHVDHGIGRYDGLATLEVGGAPHDCLRILYDGGDKLFVPVENIEVLSRYGSEDALVQLDKLGGLGWQTRKARVKQRIREIAGQLIKIAAERQVRSGAVVPTPEGIYDEFCARFPYVETDDQSRAIEEVLDDLTSGRPMDRLICGDVGFGKTEVALRAAFVAVMAGFQVAVITPTTLLCRQHYRTFSERFAGLPVRIKQLSRLVTGKDAAEVKAGIKAGTVDIVIGTHALLGKGIEFKSLGLLIVDEEQHFGVAQKERLKELRTDVHVLTLTATPIPRTLQMALSGVREMSLIATPPVDRLAVRTFVLPYDPVILREAILREHYRGGQTFYVCPRIEDLDKVAERLRELVPEIKFVMAHGQMPARQLEQAMTAFYDRQYDLLLSTSIVESGLDIPTANTIVIHRADMFGLSQLYQLRGRIGRSKLRGYAYLTLPPTACCRRWREKRLQVMQTLDTLGAGFTLASHDLDIRGAGNLLGEEQSGHIREVGIELYQHMLEEAVQEARGAARAVAARDLDAADQPGHARADPRELRRRPRRPPRPLPAHRRAARPRRDRRLRRRDDRPLRPAAARGREPAADHRHEAPLPRRRHRQGGGRPEGRRARRSATTSSPSRRTSSPSSASARPSSACAPTTSSSTARPGTTPRPASPASTS